MSVDRKDQEHLPLRALDLGELPPAPLVSVLIDNYNYEHNVGHAIASVLAQSYPNLEVIVCDDGSTDDSWRIIESIAQRDPRVRVIKKRNGGHASALNAAFCRSKGQILCALDADDTFVADKVERVGKVFQANPAVGFVIHAMMVTDQSGRPTHQIPLMTRFEEGWIAETIVRRGGRRRFMLTSALCQKIAIAKLTGQPERMRTNQTDCSYGC